MQSKNVPSKPAINPKLNYNLVDQLQRTPAQISIFKLLELSLRHKQVLEDALQMANVPKNLDFDQFQNMVNHISIPHYLSLSEQDDKSLIHLHNLSLDFEVMIHKTCVKHMLIDGGVGLNICFVSLLQTLGFSEQVIDTRRKVIIKAYDEAERSSKGLAVLPVRTGPIEKDVLF